MHDALRVQVAERQQHLPHAAARVLLGVRAARDEGVEELAAAHELQDQRHLRRAEEEALPPHDARVLADALQQRNDVGTHALHMVCWKQRDRAEPPAHGRVGGSAGLGGGGSGGAT